MSTGSNSGKKRKHQATNTDLPQKERTKMGIHEEMRIIVDTDGGLDDALSIMLAVDQLPYQHIACITSVFGNVPVSQAHHNVFKVLEIMEHHEKIPIYCGASSSLVSSNSTPWEGHGPDGLGGAVGLVPDSIEKYPHNQAVDAMIKEVRNYPGEVTIVALGPLTNVALATKIYPQFPQKIKKLIFMGCTSRGIGNTTPHAEFNVASDPEATHIVLESFSADKLQIFSWELCLDYPLSWSFFDELTTGNHPRSKFIKDICRFYEKVSRFKDCSDQVNTVSEEHFTPCDVYAIATLFSKDYVVSNRKAFGIVELDNGERRGANIWHFDDLEAVLNDQTKRNKPNATVISKINVSYIEEMLMKLVNKSCIKNVNKC